MSDNRFFEGSVRLAQPQDEDRIFDLLMLLHEENGIFAVSEPKVREFIRSATEQKFGIIGVIEGDEEIEASVGFSIDQFWYTDEWYLSERWNFVHPDHRKTSHAVQLIDFSKWTADRLGIPLLMGIISTQQTEAKVRMYRRRLTPVGGLFMHSTKSLQNGSGHVQGR